MLFSTVFKLPAKRLASHQFIVLCVFTSKVAKSCDLFISHYFYYLLYYLQSKITALLYSTLHMQSGCTPWHTSSRGCTLLQDKFHGVFSSLSELELSFFIPPQNSDEQFSLIFQQEVSTSV